MLILFINAHKKNEEGKIRFNNFYNNIQSILKNTLYYGNQVTQTIRTFDDLDDYIFDQISFRLQEKSKCKFQSLDYIFIDGNHNFAPWADFMSDIMIIIRKSIESSKKILCNGFGHFAAYYYLSTKFDKQYSIGISRKTFKKVDFQYNQATGDLQLKGKKYCHSGIKTVNFNRPFHQKSISALSKGIVAATKFDYVVFDSKIGNKLQNNIEIPFTFYWKSKLFCSSKVESNVKADILYETQLGFPLAFNIKNLLSTQGICSQFLQLIKNWIIEFIQRRVQHSQLKYNKSYQTIAFQNKMEYQKCISSSSTNFSKLKQTKRPSTSKSKFSTIEFQKPSVRCSGMYQTLNQRYLHQENQNKKLNLGKSRLIFSGKLNEMQIGNYVQRQPSRPATSHKFRQTHKDKWVGKSNFINC